MLKKRIYLPEGCKELGCETYKILKEKCQSCPIYVASIKERSDKTVAAHRRASVKYYHKQKVKKVSDTA